MARRGTCFLLLSLCLAWGSSRAEDPAVPPIDWGTSYYEGYLRARKEGRPICLFFTACWSGPGKALREGPLVDASLQGALAPYACVRVDVDGDTLTPGRFGVKRVPGILLLDRDEKPLLPPLSDFSAGALADAFARGCEEFKKRP